MKRYMRLTVPTLIALCIGVASCDETDPFGSFFSDDEEHEAKEVTGWLRITVKDYHTKKLKSNVLVKFKAWRPSDGYFGGLLGTWEAVDREWTGTTDANGYISFGMTYTLEKDDWFRIDATVQDTGHYVEGYGQYHDTTYELFDWYDAPNKSTAATLYYQEATVVGKQRVE